MKYQLLFHLEISGFHRHLCNKQLLLIHCNTVKIYLSLKYHLDKHLYKHQPSYNPQEKNIGFKLNFLKDRQYPK